MRKTCLLILLFPFIGNAQVSNVSLNASIETKFYSIYYEKSDSSFEYIKDYVELGIREIETFFERNFKSEIKIYLFPTRESLDKQWQSAWKMPTFKSECWMVGSGVESRLDLLSPSIWSKQACEHDPNDLIEIRLLVFHELTHVLHSDYNRSPSFEDINNIDWMVEGLATFASGQLDSERHLRTLAHVKETGGPMQLSEFWKGEHKYGLSGSMIAYIDARYGRELLSDILQYNDVNDILEALELTEDELIKEWRKALLNMK